jgi:hypothetical protein
MRLAFARRAAQVSQVNGICAAPERPIALGAVCPLSPIAAAPFSHRRWGMNGDWKITA